MSENSEDVILAHDTYVEENNINVNQFPADIVAKYEALDQMIEAYDADQNPDKTTDEIEAKSVELKNEIQAWHESVQAQKAKEEEENNAKVAAKAKEEEEKQKIQAQQNSAPPAAPAQVEEEDDDDDISYTRFLNL